MCRKRRKFKRVLAPEGEILSFARPKRKSRPDTAYFLRAAVAIGGCQMGLLPHCQRTACPMKRGRLSMPCPYGLFPITTSVLGAVYGSFSYAARNINNLKKSHLT